MAERVTLKDRTIKSLIGKVPPAGGKRDMLYMDTVVSPLGIRPSGKGYRYAFVGRFPGFANPTRRDLGAVGSMSLAEARAKARKWVELIERGADPKLELERERQLELRKQAHTFAAVAEDYLAGPIAKLRTAKDTERLFRKELFPRLGKRPIAEVTRLEVEQLLTSIKGRPARRTAMICHQHLSGLYRWAIEEETYGLESSPTATIRAKTFFGKQKPRTRVLTDPELRAFWHATEQFGYPYGAVLQLLLLTGCRQAEIGAASWVELSPDRMTLSIPPERFKMDAVHLVPLSGQARGIIDTLPRFASGDYMFSFAAGAKPVNSWGRAKQRADALMAGELGRAPAPWTIHDLRRTCRTRLSSLTSFEVAEAIIGHSQRGMARVYNQETYLEPMRTALEAWAARLRSIVEPPAANVVRFGGHVSA
jgi:integrase